MKCPLSKRKIVVLGLCALSALPALANSPQANGISDFGVSLFRAVGKTSPGQNLLVSPLSAWMALDMLAQGTVGPSREELDRVLQLQKNDSSFARDFLKESAADSSDSQGFTLEIANRLFLQKGEALQKKYSEDLARDFQSTVGQVDYRAHLEDTRNEINRWVEKTTHQKIKELLGPNSLTQSMVLTLVNALYLKADWATPFRKDLTSHQKFYSAADQEIEVPFMNRQFGADYFETPNVQVLKIPYQAKDSSMILFSPKAGTTIEQLEAQFTAERFNQWTRSFKPDQPVNLSLPRFKLESSMPLSQPLKEIGMQKIFTPDHAGLTGILASKSKTALSVSEVIQKTTCEVDETGTVASAATAISIKVGSAMRVPPMVRMNLDHPFLFAIQSHGVTLFLGRMMKPAS